MYNMYFVCILCVFVLEFIFIFDIMCVLLYFMYIGMDRFELSNVLGHANQFDVLCNGVRYFYSYSSLICAVDICKRELTFYSDWNYSKTTRKHLYAFLSELWFWGLNCKKNIEEAIRTHTACCGLLNQIEYYVELWY